MIKSAVKKSHDRYESQEGSYLLNKIKRYRELMLLSFNHNVCIGLPLGFRLKSLLEFPPSIPSPLSQSRR